VQARLDDAFGGDLRIADKESLDGFFALTPGAGLFQRLHDSFDYVTEVVDNARVWFGWQAWSIFGGAATAN